MAFKKAVEKYLVYFENVKDVFGSKCNGRLLKWAPEQFVKYLFHPAGNLK